MAASALQQGVMIVRAFREEISVLQGGRGGQWLFSSSRTSRTPHIHDSHILF